MKKITLLIYLLLVTIGAKAQDCGAALVPYYENFESVVTPALPGCSTSISATNNQWTTSSNPGNGFTSKTLQYTGNGQAANAWYFTRGVQITAGTKYKITHRYGNNGVATEKLRFTYGLAPDAESAKLLGSERTITNGASTLATFTYTVFPTTGTYYFGFQVTSDAGTGNVYVDDFSIEQSTCGVPESLSFTSITTNSATASWLATTGGNVPSLGFYEYAIATSNTPPSSGKAVFSTNVSLTDLLPNTVYYVFVRTVCGGNVYSEWAVSQFITPVPCAVAEVPYTQNFETATVPAIPQCNTVSPVTTGNQWATVASPNSNFTGNTLFYQGINTAANATYYTQGIQLTAGTFYKITYKVGNNSTTTSEGLKVTIGTGTDADSVTATLYEDTAITGGTAKTVTSNPIVVGVSGTYYFGFNATSAAAQGNLYIDDINVKLWDCGIAQNIKITNINQTGATITWDTPAENTSFGYFCAVNTTNTPPGGGPYISGLTTTLADLLPGTTYYVFVKSQCGPLTGDWSEGVSFTTPACVATSVPYIQGFEQATVPTIPACTTIYNAGTGSNWGTAANPGNGFASNALQYNADATNVANAWFFTQGVTLTAGTYYKISYKYGNNSATTTEKFKVVLATNPNADWLVAGNPLGNHTVTGATVASNDINYFNVPASGVYYFGINVYSDAAQGTLYVDDFSIVESSCGAPASTISAITQTGATITWAVPAIGNSPISVYQYAYSTTNTPPIEGIFNPSLTVDLKDLKPGTTYYVYTRSQCGPLWSDWTVTSFTTKATAGTVNYSFKGLAVYPNPVKNNISIDNIAGIDAVELYTITGQLLLKQAVNATTATINLEKFAAGTYLLTIYADGMSKKVKVIKQ